MGFPAGVAALVILLFAVVTGVGIGGATTGFKSDAASQVKMHACVSAFTALVFWLWAMYNCEFVGFFDWGAACFPPVFIASGNAFRIAAHPDESAIMCQQILVLTASLIVVATYFAAAVIYSHFGAYLKLYF